MEKNNQIPSNYVTLSQLQERWLKEKQLRNLKDNEKELQETENQQLRPRHLQNEDNQPKIDAPKLKEATIRNRGRNQNFEESFPCASSKEALVGLVAVVEEKENESAGIETKSKDLGDDTMDQKRKRTWKKPKNKKKRGQKEKMEKDGETETKVEGIVMVREAHAPPAKSEKNIPSKYVVKRDTRPKYAGIVEKSDGTVEMEGKVKDVMEKSKDAVEIEKNIGDLCIGEGSERSETQNNAYNRRNSGYRSRGRIVNNRYSKDRGDFRTVNHSDSEYRGYNGGFNRQRAEHRVYNGGGYRGNGHYRESYGRSKGRDSGNEMVWVKKDVAVGVDDA